MRGSRAMFTQLVSIKKAALSVCRTTTRTAPLRSFGAAARTKSKTSRRSQRSPILEASAVVLEVRMRTTFGKSRHWRSTETTSSRLRVSDSRSLVVISAFNERSLASARRTNFSLRSASRRSATFVEFFSAIRYPSRVTTHVAILNSLFRLVKRLRKDGDLVGSWRSIPSSQQHPRSTRMRSSNH